MRTFASSSLLILTLAACAANPDSSASAESEAALVSDEMCDTIDYGPRQAPDNLYQFFPTSADAASFMQELEDSGLVQQVGGPDAYFREISTDPRITGLIAEAFRGMKMVFPRETAGLDTVPPVAIIQTSVQNAYALPAGVGGLTKAPWLFVIHSAIEVLPDDQLLGVIAHELGHLILRNYTADVRPLINAAYRVEPGQERGIFGAKQVNDPVVAEHIVEVLSHEQRVGFAPELGLTSSGAYLQLLNSFVDVRTSACADLPAAQRALIQAQAPFMPSYRDLGPVRPHPTAGELANIQRLQAAAYAALHACLATDTDPTTFRSLYESFGYPADLVAQFLLPAEAEADTNLTLRSLSARVFAATDVVLPNAVALRANPALPFDQLRFYDAEEDSDDAAVRVLRALGRDPIGNGRFLLGSLSPAARAACEAAVTAGSAIDYGENRDPHPADCWRYFHAVELSKSLASCSVVPKKTRKASGGSQIVTRRDPLDFIDRNRTPAH